MINRGEFGLDEEGKANACYIHCIYKLPNVGYDDLSMMCNYIKDFDRLESYKENWKYNIYTYFLYHFYIGTSKNRDAYKFIEKLDKWCIDVISVLPLLALSW